MHTVSCAPCQPAAPRAGLGLLDGSDDCVQLQHCTKPVRFNKWTATYIPYIYMPFSIYISVSCFLFILITVFPLPRPVSALWDTLEFMSRFQWGFVTQKDARICVMFCFCFSFLYCFLSGWAVRLRVRCFVTIRDLSCVLSLLHQILSPNPDPCLMPCLVHKRCIFLLSFVFLRVKKIMLDHAVVNVV